MKKTILVAFAFIGAFTMTAQEANFGIAANFQTAGAKVSVEDVDETDGAIGFSVGGFVEINLSEKLFLQPEVLFTSVKGSEDDEAVQFLQVPLFLKYYAAEKFYVHGGPQITYTLEETFDDFTKFNIGIGAGLGYEFTENLYAQFRTTYQLNNYYTGNADVKSRINFFNVGLGYKF